MQVRTLNDKQSAGIQVNYKYQENSTRGCQSTRPTCLLHVNNALRQFVATITTMMHREILTHGEHAYPNWRTRLLQGITSLHDRRHNYGHENKHFLYVHASRTNVWLVTMADTCTMICLLSLSVSIVTATIINSIVCLRMFSLAFVR